MGRRDRPTSGVPKTERRQKIIGSDRQVGRIYSKCVCLQLSLNQSLSRRERDLEKAYLWSFRVLKQNQTTC